MEDLLAFNCLTWLFVNENPVVNYPIEDITVSRAWMVHIPGVFLWRWAQLIPITFMSEAGCIRAHREQEQGGKSQSSTLTEYADWFQPSTNAVP